MNAMQLVKTIIDYNDLDNFLHTKFSSLLILELITHSLYSMNLIDQEQSIKLLVNCNEFIDKFEIDWACYTINFTLPLCSDDLMLVLSVL